MIVGTGVVDDLLVRAMGDELIVVGLVMGSMLCVWLGWHLWVVVIVDTVCNSDCWYVVLWNVD